MIEIKNVSYAYQKEEGESEKEIRYALKDISFKVKKGEFIAVLGHNGSGKSTLAKLLNVQILPTKGDIFYDGVNTKNEEKLWDIRKLSSMVFQNPDNQMVATTVEEDVAFGPENLSIPNPKLRNTVDEALKLVSMYEYRKKPPHELSGGQKQRVSIAGVIAMMSDYIVFDEPTAMLDPEGRKDVLNIVEDLHKNHNKTIIYITHYMEEAVKADRVIVLNKGEIVMDDTPKNCFSQVEKMRNLKLDVPQITKLAYLLQKEGKNFETLPLTVDEMLEMI